MSFNEEKRKYSNMLRKIGANVMVNEVNHELIVNEKYIFDYANSYYRRIGELESTSRGIGLFMELIKSEM